MSAQAEPLSQEVNASSSRISGLWIVYAWIAYLLFARSAVYWILFLANRVVGKTVDHGGVEGPTALALAVDLLWLGVFCAHHSLLARTGAKRWLERYLPQPVERSTYVLVSSLLLVVLLWQWRPLPAAIWSVQSEIAALALEALSWAGWGTAFLASLRLGHFETFGVRRVWAAARSRPHVERPLKTDSLYGWVRHPMYLGFLVGIWATPRMSVGHLLMAAVLSAYLFLGRTLEERELVRRFGDGYRRYRSNVPALMPRLRTWRRK